MSTETPTPANHNLDRTLTKGDLIDCLARVENECARMAEFYKEQKEDPHQIRIALTVVHLDLVSAFQKIIQEILVTTMRDPKKPAPTPESDSETLEFAPTNDPRYEGPVEWVPAWKARELERQRDEYDKARQEIAAMIGRAAPHLEVKTHGYIQNDREKKLAFEREDAMKDRPQEAMDTVGEMADRLDSLAGASKLPLPAETHKPLLVSGIENVSKSLKSLVIKITGKDPWKI